MAVMRAEFAPGETIFSEGDPGHHCYQIVAGLVEIRLRRRGFGHRDEHEVVARLGPGEVFGEMSIIDDAPRSATAVAVERTVCAHYPAEELLELFTTDPEAAAAIIKTLIRRLRSANRKLARSG